MGPFNYAGKNAKTWGMTNVLTKIVQGYKNWNVLDVSFSWSNTFAHFIEPQNMEVEKL